MLAFLQRISFRGLICISLGLIGLTLVAAAATIYTLRNDAIEDAISDISNIAGVLAEQTERSVQALDIAVSQLAERYGEASFTEHELDAALRWESTHQLLVERLARLTQTDFVALVDKNGRLANTSRGWPAQEANFSDREYFKFVRDNPGAALFVSDVVLNRISDKQNILFAKRIQGPDGEFRGAVVTGITLSYFRHIYDSITSLRNQSFLLLSKDGTVLIRHPDPDQRAGTPLPSDSPWYRLVTQGGGYYRSPGYYDDSPRLVSVRPLKDYPLVVNVAVSEVAALAQWSYRAIPIAIGTLLAFLCMLLLLYALNQKFAQFAASRKSLSEREARLAEKTQELERANLRLDTAINNMIQGVVMFDHAARLVICNRRYLEIYGLPADVVHPGMTLPELLHHRMQVGMFFEDVTSYSDELTAKMKAGIQMVRDVELPDGRTFCVTNKPTGDGGWVATHEDISARRRGEKELQRARNMLSAVIENVPEMLVVKDAVTRRYVFANRACESFLGVSREELIGKTSSEVFPTKQGREIEGRDSEALRSGQLYVENSPVRTLNGRVRDIVSKRIAISGHGGQPEYLLNLMEDVTERLRKERQIAHLAHHDHLTDLPNRAAAHLKLAETLKRRDGADGKFALLCIDLDRFKEINDLYGHATGDSMLLELTKRMEAAGDGTFLARLGGDEFMAICVDGAMPEAATALAQRMVEAVSGDIDCDGRKLRIGLSIGIAMFPADGTDIATLLRNADAALYRAKAEGRGSIRFFEADMDRMLRDRRTLQADIALAVSRNELQVFYQPQARVSGEIIGFEALLRWDHLRRGFVAPDTFIPLAEESGLIDQIGEWVLREACREAASWRKPLQIAINLSPVQLRQPEFVALVHSVLLETGLAPDRLVMEITEGALLDDYSRAVSILRRLKTLGVRIAMDDFGTGYSSLSYLQSFPFDKIKIDQTFIANLERNAQSAAIVRAVLGLGRSLNLTTVAEGVETQTQFTILRSEGCDEMQGFLFGRPQPIVEYAEIAGRPGRAPRATVTS